MVYFLPVVHDLLPLGVVTFKVPADKTGLAIKPRRVAARMVAKAFLISLSYFLLHRGNYVHLQYGHHFTQNHLQFGGSKPVLGSVKLDVVDTFAKKSKKTSDFRRYLEPVKRNVELAGVFKSCTNVYTFG